MNIKIGRNDPCYCGSTKKYKKCCLLKQEENSGAELVRRRVQKMHSGLAEKMMSFVHEYYPANCFEGAWDYFYGNHISHERPYQSFSPGDSLNLVFYPWVFFNWYPALSHDTDDLSDEVCHLKPSQLAMQNFPSRFNHLEKEYMLAANQRAFSFYQVQSFQEGVSVEIKDLLTGKLFTIQEKEGSKNLRPGYVLFTGVVQVEGFYFYDGLCTAIIPSRLALDIIDYREVVEKGLGRQMNESDLHIEQDEIRDFFLHILYQMKTPPKRVLTNTDGEPLILQKMLFDIESPHEMFESLYRLSRGITKKELLADAKLDSDKKVTHVEFPWIVRGKKQNSTWDNTIFGHINIEKNKMSVSVNSDQRAKKFQTILTKKAKCTWKLKTTLIESIDSKMSSSVQSSSSTEEESRSFAEIPEVIALQEEFMKKHWENWLVTPVPALGNISPEKATQSKKGREKLHALLLDFENMASENPMPGQTTETIQELRRRLGLFES